jgi:hypothetical protein
MESGPMADNNPNITIRKKELRLAWGILPVKLGYHALNLADGVIYHYHRGRGQRTGG